MGQKQLTDQAVEKFIRQVNLLHERGFLYVDIAGKLGMTDSYLSSLVKGTNRPGKDAADKLKGAFGPELKKFEREEKARKPKVSKVEDPNQKYLTRLNEQDRELKDQKETIQKLENKIASLDDRMLAVEENTKKILDLLEEKR